MTELATTTLLDRAQKALKTAENAFLSLASILHEVFTAKAYEGRYDDFRSYCETELNLPPSKASKLLAVGKFVNENQFKKEELEGASYTTVYESLQLHKGEDPQLVLAEAKTNTLADIRRNRNEKTPHEPEWKKVCVVPGCWTPEETHP